MTLSMLVGQSYLCFIFAGSDKNFLFRVGSGNFFEAWVGSRSRKFPPKIQNFSIFYLWKNLIGSGLKISGSKPDQPHIYRRSEVHLGQIRAHLKTTQMRPSFVRYKIGLSVINQPQAGTETLFKHQQSLYKI